MTTEDLNRRTNLSRRRLAASELGKSGRAWLLWAVCMAQTTDEGRAMDRTYAKTLATAAGVSRQFASVTLRRFHELGVVVWIPAPAKSRDTSTLRLPDEYPLPNSSRATGALEVTGPLPTGALDLTLQRQTKDQDVRSRDLDQDHTSVVEGPRDEVESQGGGPSEPELEILDFKMASGLDHAPVVEGPGPPAVDATSGVCAKHGTPLHEDGRCWECLDEQYGT